MVGCVQIVEMEEQEERRVCVLIEPVHGRGRHLGARPLEITHVRDSLFMKIERAVINIEIAAQSKTPVQDETAHERCGTVAGILQNGRERCPCAERDSMSSTPFAKGYVEVNKVT